MVGTKGRSGRKKVRFLDENDNLIRKDVTLSERQLDQLEQLGIGEGKLSELMRRLIAQFVKTPQDLEAEEILEKMREHKAALAILEHQLEEVNQRREKAKNLNFTIQREAPVRAVIISRIERMTSPQFLGAHVADRAFDLGLVERASYVQVLAPEWVKVLLPFVSKVIIDDVKGELERSGLAWPKSYSQEEALRFALVNVCEYPESVLEPLNNDEKVEIIKKSVIKRFPSIDNGIRKEATDFLAELLKAYSINLSARETIERFYGKNEGS